MKKYLTMHQMVLKSIGPVYVGSGRELNKKEYVFLPNQKVGVVDIQKLYALMTKKALKKQFEEYMMYDNKLDLKTFLSNNKIDIKMLEPCLKYILDNGDTALQRGTRTQIMECVKTPFGEPYIPGSSIKGMLRNVLLSWDIMNNPNKYNSVARIMEQPYQGKVNRSIYNKEIKQIEQSAFCTLERQDTKPNDAVNDVMSGIVISDSEPLVIDDIVLCQKIERHIDGTEKTLNLLRECIRPDREIRFTITIDSEICPYDIDDIYAAIEEFNNCYNECFLRAFRQTDLLQDKHVYIGGGTGYVSKTVTYPLYGKTKGIQFARNVFNYTGVPREHKHIKDVEYGVSPHILKCTKYQGRILHMGLCMLKQK